MSEGKRVTRIDDAVYDLTSVLFHVAEGGQNYSKYIEDADRAWRAKSLLGQR